MDTNKKSMKEDLDPSSATLYIITTSVKCKENKKYQFWNYEIPDFTNTLLFVLFTS